MSPEELAQQWREQGWPVPLLHPRQCEWCEQPAVAVARVIWPSVINPGQLSYEDFPECSTHAAFKLDPEEFPDMGVSRHPIQPTA